MNINKGNLVEVFLGRLYEEKGHILALLATSQEASANADLPITTRTRALQCYNSAHAILAQFPEQAARLEAVTNSIRDLSKDKRVTRKLQVVGKFSTEYLDANTTESLEKAFKGSFGDVEGQSTGTGQQTITDQEDDGESQTMLMIAAGASAAVAVGAYLFYNYRKGR